MTEKSSGKIREHARRRGYRAGAIPGEWVGEVVEMKVLSGRGEDSLLGVDSTRGLLESAEEAGYVISAEKRTVFYPLHAVLAIELYDEQKSTKLRD